jgi:transposase
MKETVNKKQIHIGVDVSKKTLDVCCLVENQRLFTQISNTSKSVKSFINKVSKQYTGYLINVCIENTGYYNWPIYEAISDMCVNLYVINSLHLKRSLGLIRGKNDKIDSKRIADFLQLHYPKLTPYKISRKEIRIIQALLAQRKRLVSIRTSLKAPVEELKAIGCNQVLKQLSKSNQLIIKQIDKQILEVEKQIMEIIENDTELSNKYRFITSVQGVGKVLAWYMIVKTNEFKSINDPRKLACYAGVVPFEYQSGTSIHRRPRVSLMADHTLKKLLHLSAMRAIRLNGELRDYYLRKIEDGKNKMLVLNAVRNKIVARICSVVNNQRMYQNNLVLS